MSTTTLPRPVHPHRGDRNHRHIIARAERRITSAAAARGRLDDPAVLAIFRRYVGIERTYLTSGTWSDDPDLTVLADAVTKIGGAA